jgi:hypothetical protein
MGKNEDDEEDRAPRRWGDLAGFADPFHETGARLDHELGKRLPEPEDPDEALLDGLEAHLRGTGDYSPDGSVWRPAPQGLPKSLPRRARHAEVPPPYRGPRGRRRPWWRFW